ncbi:hypothetical protein C6P40_004333 [Pichia californica]|uniref:Cell wall mannoprotein PIR1-like C-terminal domain-containing protein n=1 Tax=Pichia californica TaxID=460514 RepID=A0A9P6WPN6_9ASCO|nr:hypothetical protein C6P42_000192 [[Candida] californica]KAG0689863.1 hypothetical protein C6P40_004333 [[Candida] californica]
MRFSLSVLSVIASAMAATVPSSAWTTLTPTAVAPSCAVTDYPSSFGIAISTITTEVNIKAKRDVATQINDGQIQATTGTEQESTVATTTSSSSTKETSTTVENADYTVTEDQTLYVSYSGSSAKASAATNPAVIVTQIGDGQIQIPNPTPIVTESYIVSSNSETTSTSTSYLPITSSSSFSYRSISSKSESSKTSSQASSSSCPTGSIAKEATCKSKSDLAMTLEDGLLIDSAGRIGSIVANRQFQFDGPPPQAGAIYAAGWSIDDGHLVIGEDYIFWECLSGTFYNIYDESIGDQCIPVTLNVIDLVDC